MYEIRILVIIMPFRYMEYIHTYIHTYIYIYIHVCVFQPPAANKLRHNGWRSAST